MLHFGATLRLLRLDAGLGLRELAARIGISSAYLSRVENGHDPIPTAERLAAIADVLGISRAVLFDLARQTGPSVSGYIQRVPASGALLAEFARRDLSFADIAKIRAFVDREFPRPRLAHSERPALARLIGPTRALLQVSCPSIPELIQLAVARVTGSPIVAPHELARKLIAREQSTPSWLGDGIVAPHGIFPGIERQIVVVTLRQPLMADTPDNLPVRAAFLLLSGTQDDAHGHALASIARLVSYPDVLANIMSAQNTAQVNELIADAESLW